MNQTEHTRFDDNPKRIAPGALVSLANASKQTHTRYYLHDGSGVPAVIQRDNRITILEQGNDLAKALIGKMKGEKLFYRHDLLIEFIEWPGAPQGRTR